MSFEESRAQRIEALFDAIAQLPDAEARRALAEAARDDPTVREAVERLLRADRAAASTFPAQPPIVAPPVVVPDPTPARIGKYSLVRKLGEGGMGVVYVGYDEALDRRVAIKLLHGATARGFLMREAQALARLAHPNVVHVHEVGEDAGRPFVVMELIEGDSLRAWLASEPRKPESVIALFVQVARGLAAAHAVGIVHRDVKPDNVLVGRDGRARVLDFGIAALGASAPVEGRAPRGRLSDFTAGFAGTPAYMAPEQLLGERATPATDQFALSVALYRALFGAAPFEGEDLASLKESVTKGALTERRVPEGVPVWIVPIVMRGLAREPAARFASMDAFREAIEARLPRDPELDPNPGRPARVALGLAMLLAAVGTDAVISIRGGAALADPRKLVYVAFGLMLLHATAVLALRKRLLVNAFARRTVAMLFVMTSAMLVHRLIALHLGLTSTQILPVDLLILAACFGVGTITLSRPLAGPAAVMLLGMLATLAAPTFSVGIFGASVLAGIALVVVSWRSH